MASTFGSFDEFYKQGSIVLSAPVVVKVVVANLTTEHPNHKYRLSNDLGLVAQR